MTHVVHRADELIRVSRMAAQADRFDWRFEKSALYYLAFGENGEFLRRSEQELGAFSQWRDCSPLVRMAEMDEGSQEPRDQPPQSFQDGQRDHAQQGTLGVREAEEGVRIISSGLLAYGPFVEEYGLDTSYARIIVGPFLVCDYVIEKAGFPKSNIASKFDQECHAAWEFARGKGIEPEETVLERLFTFDDDGVASQCVRVWIKI